ncbi:MAG: TerB family tellurite resistance protein [Rhodospirillales bacterium]
MIDRLIALFTQETAASRTPHGHPARDLRLAAAALLVETAMMDGEVDAAEMEVIRRLLADYFGLSEDESAELIADGRAAAADSSQLYGFTRVIKDRFSPEERVQMIEMLWEVAYTDDRLHHLETNLIRRIAGLIYVPDRESGEARQRVLAKKSAGAD